MHAGWTGCCTYSMNLTPESTRVPLHATDDETSGQIVAAALKSPQHKIFNTFPQRFDSRTITSRGSSSFGPHGT